MPEVRVTHPDLNRVEFHRNAFGRMPDPLDGDPGVAVMVMTEEGRDGARYCSCSGSRKKTCGHVKELVSLFQAFPETLHPERLEAAFSNSLWYALAVFFGEEQRAAWHTVTFRAEDDPDGSPIHVFDAGGRPLLTYLSTGPDRSGFVERCCARPDAEDRFSRGRLLDRLTLHTLTPSERQLHEAGYKSRGMVFRETFWYRLAYHGFREFGSKGCALHPAIDTDSGAFTVTCTGEEDRPVFRLAVARKRVKAFIRALAAHLTNPNGLSLEPVPVDLIFDARMRTDQVLEVQPALRIVHEKGQFRTLDEIDFDRFQYGDLVYIESLNMLADMTDLEDEPATLRPSARKIVERSQVPAFLQAHRLDIESGKVRVPESLGELTVFDRFDRVEIRPEAMERDWCWLSVEYGFGNIRISLAEILHTCKAGRRYLATGNGWVDCQAPFLDPLLRGLKSLDVNESEEGGGRIKLDRMDVLRLQAFSGKTAQLVDGEGDSSRLSDFLRYRPSRPLPPLAGLRSALRAYQRLGVEWLWFLVENSVGGLLCDDMGLGKTHQVMALMVALGEVEGDAGPFLVVCPTTVLSHWEDKIREHAPELSVSVHHGPQRNLEDSLASAGVLVTSYGILRQDREALQEISFRLAVFDEIQTLKNPRTRGFQAAAGIHAEVKLGLTGTPVENSLTDLKALLDLAVPGYLPSQERFRSRYVEPIEADPESDRREELRRLVSPFTLRRLKRTVLDELPEKIEDIRTCRLSEDQVKLYRDAVESHRRSGALDALDDESEPVPYLHVFALLMRLKQICDHPVLVDGEVKDPSAYASGKWDLFRELLAEILDSGQKVVVYSQFLGMIDLIAGHLDASGVPHCVLTGGSRNRGAIVRRFNTDPECRVFVGSLKAGGTGIDLTAASVVIHYDRWWNAAREDQATDRVHRIGQQRGVQVFKLITRGTLEEKIAAIIRKKKKLMDSAVPNDDPRVLKMFTRQELADLLAIPQQV